MDNRYYFLPENIVGAKVTIEGQEAAHISRVRRCKCGDKIVAFCGDGYDYILLILEMTKNTVICEVADKKLNKAFGKEKIVIYLAMIKNDALTTAIDNLAELNVSRVVLFKCDYSVAEISENKLDKLTNIAIQASKQSERADVMQIEIMKQSDIRYDILKYNNRFFAYEDATGMNIITDSSSKNFAVIIGPEGGFSQREVAYFSDFASTISLSDTILRAEVACVAAVSMIKMRLK